MTRLSEARANVPEPRDSANSESWDVMLSRVMEYRAPWLEAKYVQTGLADSPEQAAQLFLELKKFLALAAFDGGTIPMASSLIDVAWHQFIQHTERYASFCQGMWGRFQHHVPRPAQVGPAGTLDEHGDPLRVESFVSAYERRFGAPPDVWFNERNLEDASCLVRPDLRPLAVELTPACVELQRGEQRQVVCRASARAEAAVRFIAAHKRFLVRELPGLQNVEERLRLVRPLVQFNVLELAP